MITLSTNNSFDKFREYTSKYKWNENFEIQTSLIQTLENLQNFQPTYKSPRSSLYLGLDLIDEVDYSPEDKSEDAYRSISGRTSFLSDSTDSNDINKQNEEFRYFLNRKKDYFVSELRRVDFEDGMNNNLVIEVCTYISKNKYATYMWLLDIYASFQQDADVLAGILRIISSTTEKDDFNSLTPLVKAGLADIHSKTQEAALMVIETWRTQQCLDVLQTRNTTFTSEWIEKYANLIEKELKEELKNAITDDFINK